MGQEERCNTTADYSWLQVNAPSRYQRFSDLENFTTNYINNQGQSSNRLINGNGIIVIPVVVHVLHRGEAEGTGYNISMSTIQSQIDVLNEDFRRLNPDAVNTPSAFQTVASDFGIEFRLACIDPNGNLTNGVVRKYSSIQTYNINVNNVRPDGTIDDDVIGIKKEPNGSTAWNTNQYLNIWVCNMSLAGYGAWPADFAIYPQFDGIVIDKEAFGRTGGTTSGYDKGRTATHEIGHWLNLKHLWGDRNAPEYNFDCSKDDLVGDSPQQKTYHTGCPSFPELLRRCNASDVSTMFMNYMDFVNDNCYNLFTNGQKLRARALFAVGGPREQQLNNWFKVRQSATPLRCSGIVYSSPVCFPTTWTLLSGPATLTPGPGVNQATLQATGIGNVSVRATSGNYTTDDIISVTNVPPSVQGYYFFSSNYYSCPGCQNGMGPNNSQFLPAGQTGCFTANLINAGEFSNIQWVNSGYLVSYFLSNNNTTINFCMVAGPGAYTQRITTFTINAQSSCGLVSQPINFGVITQGWGNYRVSIFPNPTKNKIQLVIDEESEEVKLLSRSEKINIELINSLTSQKVGQWIFNNSQKEISLNINGLRKGLYLLIVRKGKYQETKQIIIEE